MLPIIACLGILTSRPSLSIAKITPSELYIEMGGSYPDRNPRTCSFTIAGSGFRRTDRCQVDGADVKTRFRSSHRLDVQAPIDVLLKRSGQADGRVTITVGNIRAHRVSNSVLLKTRFRAIGG